MPDELMNYKTNARPGTKVLTGEGVVLQPFDPSKHIEGLFDAVGGEENAQLWQHLPIGPFLTSAELLGVLSTKTSEQGWQPVIICERANGRPLGLVAYMCIRKDAGSAELGCVVFGHKLQRTKAATEAFSLLAQHIFEDCHYRRYEWNCNAANAASMRAALRFGFKHEACFRNDMVVKGMSRDTEWYAMTCEDWPAVKRGFQNWLAPENFQTDGTQIHSLAEKLGVSFPDTGTPEQIMLPNWEAPTGRLSQDLSGRYVDLQPYTEEVHAEGLFACLCGETDDDIWVYLPVHKPTSVEQLTGMLALARDNHGWQTMVIRSVETEEILGMASYMRHRPEHGCVEVGCVAFSKKLQRTREATDAMFLMVYHAMETVSYRRYEWKCNDKNVASKHAALRFGFTYEGVFRNDRISKGESRDTAWYSITDSEWQPVKAAFEAWLKPGNFEKNGNQKLSLAAIRDLQG